MDQGESRSQSTKCESRDQGESRSQSTKCESRDHGESRAQSDRVSPGPQSKKYVLSDRGESRAQQHTRSKTRPSIKNSICLFLDKKNFIKSGTKAMVLSIQ